MTVLFDPLRLRDLEVPNRVWMSPMCTYSAVPDGDEAGRPTDFHLAHYAGRAAGGAGLVMVEATAVAPEGRISPYDLGLWDDSHIPDFARLAQAIRNSGAVPAIQLAHAGRKASVDAPWHGNGPVSSDNGGWTARGASPIAFPGCPEPSELSVAEIGDVTAAFGQAARRAFEAGFEVVEVHAAHGYLLHSFLSPLSNQRNDAYGGSRENRARIVLEATDAIRASWPETLPVLLRVSTTDWVAENHDDNRTSWTLDDTVTLATWAAAHGIDLVDCSSGGLVPAPIPHDVDYQTRYAAEVRRRAGVPVGAVGRITEPEQAARLVENEDADVVLLGRSLLRDPSWANNAARELGRDPRFLKQYAYAV